MNLSNHPCFNDKVRHTFGRVHLPVAPRCNIQCKFCNRKFDCVNESRPGVTTCILSPAQAMAYLETVLSKKKNISVVGIAGPGDPFANPEETMETLRRVRETYPEMLLCVATNGLNIAPFIDELARIGVSHVTVTVNAVDPSVALMIYSWVRFGKRLFHPKEGVKILLEKQSEAVRMLKEKGITVKINSIVIPGVNDTHIRDVAGKMAEMKADILNCVPYYPSLGATFSKILEPSRDMIMRVREEAAKFLPQMHHCTRCRADAVGLLGEAFPQELMSALKACGQLPETSIERPVKADDSTRPYIAVASLEGILVNQHLGEAHQLHIYGKINGSISLIETRPTPEPGNGMKRWDELGETIRDCNTLLVSGIGASPREVLTRKGIDVFEVEGLIEDAVQRIHDGQTLKHLTKRKITSCRQECAGTGGGCG